MDLLQANHGGRSILLEFEDTTDDLGYMHRLLVLLLDAWGHCVFRVNCHKYTGDMNHILRDLYEDMFHIIAKVRRFFFGMRMVILVYGFNILFESFLADDGTYQEGKSIPRIGTMDQIAHFCQRIKTGANADTDVTFLFVCKSSDKLPKAKLFKEHVVINNKV